LRIAILSGNIIVKDALDVFNGALLNLSNTAKKLSELKDITIPMSQLKIL
jgi:phosphosulfolactate phosphohydrolase-like enzyme